MNGFNLFAGTDNGVFLTTDNGANWMPVNNGFGGTISILSFAVYDGIVFAGTKGDGVYMTTNNGAHWTQANNGLTSLEISGIAESGDTVYAGTDGGGVFYSTNNGAKWIAINSGSTNLKIHTLAVIDGNLYAGTNAANDGKLFSSCWLWETSSISSTPSPVISYILPDIGTPDFNTYFEIIGPYNTNGNFGGDGLYLNNPGDSVQVVCANSADTGKIVFGPVVVSQHGKLVSTQAFVMPDACIQSWPFR